MSDFFKSWEPTVNLLDKQAFEANRRGEITSAQQSRLLSASGLGATIVLVILTIIISGIFSLVLVPVLFMGSSSKNLFSISCIGGVFSIVLLFMGANILRQVIKAFRIRQDIRKCAISLGQGQLVHNKKGYAFDMNGKILGMASDLANGLLPGVPYQVHFLEESGVLLSAVAIYQVNLSLAGDALNEILAAANRFSADDLLANRNGSVTFAQRSKLIPNIFFGAVVIVGCAIFLIVFVVSPPSSNPQMSVLNLAGAIVFSGLVSVIGFSALMKSLLDVRLSKPQELQGQVYKERRIVGHGKSRHEEYNYIVNGQRFNVGRRAYTALIDGLQYRIYYLPRTEKLIAIEVEFLPA